MSVVLGSIESVFVVKLWFSFGLRVKPKGYAFRETEPEKQTFSKILRKFWYDRYDMGVSNLQSPSNSLSVNLFGKRLAIASEKVCRVKDCF